MAYTDNQEVSKELLSTRRILMAWGDCACFGGIVTMYLDGDGEVSEARLHMLELRGFEGSCEGRLF